MKALPQDAIAVTPCLADLSGTCRTRRFNDHQHGKMAASNYAAICNLLSHSSTPDTFTPEGRKTWLLGGGVGSISLNSTILL